MESERRIARLLLNSSKLSTHVAKNVKSAIKVEAKAKKVLEKLSKKSFSDRRTLRYMKKFLGYSKEFFDKLLFAVEEDLAQILLDEYKDIASLQDGIKGDLSQYFKIDPDDEVGKTRMQAIVEESKKEQTNILKQLKQTMQLLDSGDAHTNQLQQVLSITESLKEFMGMTSKEEKIISIDKKTIQRIDSILQNMAAVQNEDDGAQKQFAYEEELHDLLIKLQASITDSEQLWRSIIRDAQMAIQYELFLYNKFEQLEELAEGYVAKVTSQLKPENASILKGHFDEFKSWKEKRASSAKKIIEECEAVIMQA